MRALCIGLTTYNITALVDSYPAEGSKNDLIDRVENGGGFAFDCSYLLAAWGVETYIASVVGNDDFGNKLKKELEQNRVKTDLLETSFDKPTMLSFVLVNKNTGATTEYHVTDEKPHLKKEDFAITPDYILGDSSEYHAFIQAVNKYPDKISLVYAHVNDLETKEICKFAKYILATRNFAEHETGIKVDFNDTNTLVNLYNNLLSRYPRSNIIITLGKDGVLYSLNGKISIIQGIDVKITDTAGASNLFRASFVYALSVGYDIEKCIRIANIAAGLSVSKVGTRISMPSLNDVLTYYTSKFGNNSNTEFSIEKNQVNATQPSQSVMNANQAQNQVNPNSAVAPEQAQQVQQPVAPQNPTPAPTDTQVQQPVTNEAPKSINDALNSAPQDNGVVDPTVAPTVDFKIPNDGSIL